MDQEPYERAAVIAEGLSWIGTLFHHQGRVKIKRAPDGTVIDRGGADCAYSLLEIYHKALPHRVTNMDFGHYAQTWSMTKAGALSERYLSTVLGIPGVKETSTPKPGDMVLFRVGLAFAHGAIIIEPGWPHIIHANGETRSFMRDVGDQGRLARQQKRFFTFWE